MIDYEEHNQVLNLFEKDVEVDRERRAIMRQVRDFLYEPDGQWNLDGIKWDSKRVKISSDRCTPLVENIWGEMAQNDFDINVSPLGMGATKEIAQRINGKITDIEAVSNAADVYSRAGKGGIEIGFDCVEVKYDYIDADSFDMDIFIEHETDAIDRVYFDSFSVDPTRKDSRHAWKIVNIPIKVFRDKYGREPQGINKDASFDIDDYSKEGVDICKIYYKDMTPRKLYLMSDGRVLSEEDDKVFDELKAQGITIVDTRNRPKSIWNVRLFDNQGWLEDPKETPFNELPIVANCPNAKVVKNVFTSRGAVEKRMDEQRVLNYSLSKAFEDNVASAKEKLVAGASQVEGREEDFNDYTTSQAEVLVYEDETNPNPPYKLPANQGSQGIQQVIDLMEVGFERGAGAFGVNPQNNKGLQSDIALKRLENRGNTGNYEYYRSQERMIAQVAKVIVGAIPNLFTEGRQTRLLNRDGSSEMVSIGETIVDEQTNEVVDVIDLSTGIYDVTCTAGPSFKNQREEANESILSMAQYDDTLVPLSKDILLKNNESPGTDLIAERIREQMLKQGVIPEKQMTDEEKQAMSAASQEAEKPDPAMTLAQAEMVKAQAALASAENDQVEQELRMIELEIKTEELELKKRDSQRSGDQNDLSVLAAAELKQAQTEKVIAETQQLQQSEKREPTEAL